MSELIYHYCSVETLRLILLNKTLRLTTAEKMNDGFECKQLQNYLISNFDKIACRCRVNVEKQQQKDNLELLLIELKTTINDKDFLSNSKIINPYLACFSKHGDLLSQWRGYADDGAGVCIGIDVSVLENYLKPPIEVFDVYYSTDAEFEDEICDCICDFAISNKSITPELKVEIEYFASEFKHSSFSEEAEMRICYFESSNYELSHVKEMLGPVDRKNLERFFKKGKEYLTKKSIVVSYYDLDISDVHKELFKSIVLGPKCRMLLDDRDLISLLADFPEVEILKSKSTLV